MSETAKSKEWQPGDGTIERKVRTYLVEVVAVGVVRDNSDINEHFVMKFLMLDADSSVRQGTIVFAMSPDGADELLEKLSYVVSKFKKEKVDV